MREYMKPFAAGLLGMALFWGAWHLYIDHANLHAVVTFLEQAQRQQAQKPPTP